jgi:hypothetical protein
MDFLAINWLAIILAAISGFIVGGIWYGPIMGKQWMGAVGLTEEDIQGGNMGQIYGTAFLFSLLASFMLDHMLTSYGQSFGFGTIVLISTGIALGFIVPAIGTNYLFSQKSRKLFFIDAGYWMLFYIAMGCVHAAFSAGQ